MKNARLLAKAGVFSCLRLFAHQRNFPGISRQLVGGLQAEGQVLQRRMPHNAGQGFQADAALAYTRVPVLAGAGGVFAVVEMDGFQAA